MIDFFKFPGEIRNKIYEELLVVPDTITIECIFTLGRVFLRVLLKRTRPHPAILLANKATNQEATLILYSENQFEFLNRDLASSETNNSPLKEFLDYIGPINASFLRHLIINPPGYIYYTNNTMGLGIHNSPLMLIQEKCTSIAILEIFLHEAGDSIYGNELDVLHTHVSSIPSLQEVRVAAHRGVYNAKVLEKMRSWGWIVELIGVEELDEYESESSTA
jgi:hypothetical protein